MKSIALVTAFFLLAILVRSCQMPASHQWMGSVLSFAGLYEVVVVVITIGVVALSCWWIGDREDDE